MFWLFTINKGLQFLLKFLYSLKLNFRTVSVTRVSRDIFDGGLAIFWKKEIDDKIKVMDEGNSRYTIYVHCR
jgi:hypothetical protein